MSRAASSAPPLLIPRGARAAGGLLAALTNAAMRVAIVPAFVMPVFDRVLSQGQAEALPRVLAVAGIVALTGAVAQYGQDAWLGAAAAALAARWRRFLYQRLLQRAPGTLPGTSGGLASRVLYDLREVELFWQYGLGTLVAESAAVLAIVGYLAVLDPAATALLVALGLPTVWGLRILGRALERVAGRSQEGSESLGRALQEGFRHHESVRAFGAGELMLDRLEPLNAFTRRAMARRAALAAAQAPVTMMLTYAAVAGLVLVLTGRVMAGALSTGEVIGYLTLVALLSTPAQLLPKGLAMASQATSAARRLRRLAEPATPAPEAPPREAGPDEETAEAPPAVRVRGLRHAFPGEGEVLRGLNLDLPARGLVVVRGRSGAGKTTLLRALLGFLRPHAGSVRLQGRPLDTLRDAELRRRVSYVPQGLDLLSGSLRENLTMGRAVPEEALWRALEAVGLAGMVRSLARGLDHELAEDGAGLSGGQRQRISLARALLNDPEVVLLDEPTSSLDDRSEAEVLEVLQREARSRLILVVAHRPAVLRAADLAWRLEDGLLREEDATGADRASP